MAVNDVYKVDLYYHAHQRQFITSFYYREIVEETGPNPAAAINAAWAAAVASPFRELLSDEAILGCLKTNIIVGDPQAGNITYFADAVGIRPSEAVPANTPMRIVLGGTTQSRASRGALIISSFGELNYVNGAFTPTYISAAVEPFITAVQQDLDTPPPGTGEFEFGYMSRAPVVAGDPLLPYPGNFVKAESVRLSPQPQTLRSRQGTHTASRGS